MDPTRPMSLNREEIAADLLWRYVELVRHSRAQGEAIALSPAELEQLAETMALVGDLPQVLDAATSPEARKAAVLQRLEAHVAVSGSPMAEPVSPPAPVASSEPASRRSPWSFLSGGSPVAAWKFRTALAVTVLLAATSISVAIVRQPEIIVKRVRVPIQASEIGIDPMEEKRVHQMLPLMLRNELPARDERNLMWHMLVCNGCYDEYVELREHQHPEHTVTRPGPRGHNLASFEQ